MTTVFFDFETGGILENFRLTSLCKHFEIPCDGAHDAFTDCRLSAAIARVMTETVLERTVRLREAAKTA